MIGAGWACVSCDCTGWFTETAGRTVTEMHGERARANRAAKPNAWRTMNLSKAMAGGLAGRGAGCDSRCGFLGNEPPSSCAARNCFAADRSADDGSRHVYWPTERVHVLNVRAEARGVARQAGIRASVGRPRGFAGGIFRSYGGQSSRAVALVMRKWCRARRGCQPGADGWQRDLKMAAGHRTAWCCDRNQPPNRWASREAGHRFINNRGGEAKAAVREA